MLLLSCSMMTVLANVESAGLTAPATQAVSPASLTAAARSELIMRLRNEQNNLELQKIPPFKLFDNLYYVGIGWVSSWMITTDQGLVLIDCLYEPYADHLVDSIRKLGFDPKDIKYVLGTHGHYDHIGNAGWLQEKYGAKVGMVKGDWDLLAAGLGSTRKIRPPRQDLVINDGDTLTLGNTTLKLYAMPGHTPGVLSVEFTVYDQRRRHKAFLHGAPSMGRDPKAEAQYFEWARRLEQREDVEVYVGMHILSDGTMDANRDFWGAVAALAQRKPGEAHPFVAPDAFRTWARNLVSSPRRVPDTSTQDPARKITLNDLKRWEKELSNWGRWAKDDQRGALNLITPAKTLAATRLVKEGVSVSMARFADLEKAVDSWTFGETKHWMSRVDPKTGEIRGALDSVSFGTHDGTMSHMDALCHYAVQFREGPPVLFNSYPQDLDAKGCKDLAVDRMGPGYVTRGILVDIPMLKGVEWLEPRTAIYVSDLEAWERFANVKIGSGDAVFVRTGRWARRAKLGPWNSAQEGAGLHASVVPWLKQREIALVGGDAVNDVQPSGVEGAPRPVHDILIPVMGVPLIDNGYFEDVAKEAARLKRWEFMTTWQIMRIPGGTATPFNALATF
jgi:hypothetical protein